MKLQKIKKQSFSLPLKGLLLTFCLILFTFSATAGSVLPDSFIYAIYASFIGACIFVSIVMGIVTRALFQFIFKSKRKHVWFQILFIFFIAGGFFFLDSGLFIDYRTEFRLMEKIIPDDWSYEATYQAFIYLVILLIFLSSYLGFILTPKKNVSEE